MRKNSLKKALLRLALFSAVLIASSVTSYTMLVVGGGGVELTITFIVALAVYSMLAWRYLKKTKTSS